MTGSDVMSHIEVPKSVLKQFEDKNHVIHTYDVKKQRIVRGYAKSLNTEMGYFSPDIEDFLGNDVEKPYTDLGRKISEANLSSNDVSVYEEEEPGEIFDVVWKYALALVLRNPKLVKQLNVETEFFPYLTDQDQHGITVKSGLINLMNKRYFRDFGVTMLLNNTNEPFIIAMDGMLSQLRPDFGISLTVSATPKLAFMLVQKKEKLITYQDSEHQQMSMFDVSQKVVHGLNIAYAGQQYSSGNGFFGSGDRPLIENIIRELNLPLHIRK